MSKPKRQHYIPQMLLQNFSFGKKKSQIYRTFKDRDTSQGDVFITPIKESAAERYFYDFSEINDSLEGDLGKIESEGTPIIKKLLNIDIKLSSNPVKFSQDGIDFAITYLQMLDEDRHKLNHFVAAQKCRTPNVIEQMINQTENFNKIFGKKSPLLINTEEGLKELFLQELLTQIDSYFEILNNMPLLLVRAEKDIFILGDDPVWSFSDSEMEYSVSNNLQSNFIVNHKTFMLPISPRDLIIFSNQKFSEFYDDILRLNDWQFIQSNHSVFSNNNIILRKYRKQYFKNCFNMINQVRPDLIKANKITCGDNILISKPRISLSPELQLLLRKQGVIE